MGNDKKRGQKKGFIFWLICMFSVIGFMNTGYAASCSGREAGKNQSSEIGLAVNLCCSSEEGAANNAALNWDTTLTADYFVVYRSLRESDGFEILYRGSGKSYYDCELEVGTTYYYQLEVVAENSHTFSDVKKVTPCVPDQLDVYSNQTGGSISYATSGTKVGDTYYQYSVKSNGNENYFVEKSSTDGKNFSNERVIVDKNDNADLGNCKLESVQQAYIPEKNTYIIWAHWELPSGYDSGKALVITGTPGGEFTLHHIYNPLNVYVRDMTIFIDDDNTGYLIAASNEEGESANKSMYIFQMNSDYSDVTRIVNKVHEGAYREFPNMVKKDGYYYLFTSQAAGWYPSQGGYIVTKDLGGTWSELRTIGNTSTFSSQSGWVLRLGGDKNFVMHAYRWLRSSDTSGTTLCPLYFANGFAFYDYYPAFRYSTATGELYPVQYGKLLSQGKPAKASVSAKASSESGTFGVENAFDGSYQSSYTASSCTWPFSMEVDLEKECDLKNVQISWYICKGSEGYYSYKIEGSTDGQNWNTILDRIDTSSERVSKTYGFTSDLVEGRARYVRIYVQNAHLHNNSNNWYTPTVYEVKVFGTDTKSRVEEAVPDIRYDFESVNSSVVEDVSGNQHNLTLNGNAKCMQDSERGNVLYLDGSDGTYGQLPTGVLDGQNAVTVSMDVKSEATGNFFTFLLGNDSDKYLFFKVRKDQFRSAISTNTWKGETGMSVKVDGSEWHNYTFVLNRETSKIYIDGVPAMATSAIGNTISDLGSNLECAIGKSTYAEDSYFKGYLDNVTIYKQALSQEQVSELAAKKHDFGEWKSDSKMHWKECSTCGEKQDEASHTFSEWEEVTAAGCEETGVEARSCTVCGYEETREIEAAGHRYEETDWKFNTNNHWHVCEICGEKQDEEAHNMEWIVDRKATDEEAGSRHEECSVCGYVGETESIPILVEEETTEEETTEGATTEGATTERATTERATTERGTTEEVTTERATTERGTTERATTERGTTERATTERGTTERVTTERGTTEEVTTERVTTERATTERVTTEEVTTERATTERGTTERATTERGTTEEVTTERATTERGTTERATTERVTTEEVTTERVTTERGTTERVTTERGTTEEETTERVTTERGTTERVTTERVTTEEETTERVTTERGTTERVTTERGTTEEETTESVTTERGTTEETTERETTEEIPQEATTERTTEGTTQEATTEEAGTKILEKGDVIEVKVGTQNATYTITNAAIDGKGTVTYVQNRNQKATVINIPKQITLDGVNYKVTAVADNAFKNNRKLKSVTIGDNVKTIGKNAFYRCTKLSKVIIGKNVTSIEKNAFYKSEKLKNIVIKGNKLKSVGKNAVKGIHKKAVIQVPKSKKKAYEKLFKKSTGLPLTAKLSSPQE